MSRNAYRTKNLENLPLIESPTDLLTTLIVGRAAQLNKNSRVLDLASGSGSSGIMLAEKFDANIEFVDNSQKRIDEAYKHSVQNNINDKCDFHCCDAISFLSTSQQSYDLILAEGGILSYYELRMVLEKIISRLSEKGYLHGSLLTKRRVNYIQKGGCDVIQDCPIDVVHQYENTVLSKRKRILLYEDEIFDEFKIFFKNVWTFRSSGITWAKYYKAMYDSSVLGKGLSEDDNFVRSIAIDEGFYKMKGQNYIDYSSFVASNDSLFCSHGV